MHLPSQVYFSSQPQHHQNWHNHNQSMLQPADHHRTANHDSSYHFAPLESFSPQLDSSIGPTRTRHLRRIPDSAPTRRASMPNSFANVEPALQHHQSVYVDHSRPQTPSSGGSSEQRFTSSPFSPYSIFPDQSRPNSDLDASSADPQPFPTFPRLGPPPIPIPPVPRPKQRKQRLYNVDRKDICMYYKNHPHARQEDIAQRYGVERSTISKILKHKSKWENIPADEGMRIAKHRPSKFPEVEEALIKWLVECSKKKLILSDHMIRTKAKETARDLNIPEEKFKASSGWVENFKHRQGIRGGVWSGEGKNAQAARAMGLGGQGDLSPLHTAFDAPSGMLADSPDVMDSDDSPEPEAYRQQQQRSAVDQPMSSLPVWPLSGQDAHRHSDASLHHAPPETSHMVSTPSHHHSTDSEHPADVYRDEYEHTQVYDASIAMYHPPPRIPDNSPPTLEDAEEAINKLITYLDTTGRDILQGDERQVLNNIKCALFQYASGVPFDRNQH